MQLGGHPLGIGQVVNAIQQHQEFVPTEATGMVPLADAAGDPLGHRLQHHIPAGVAKGVVDVLEVIEIAEQQGEGLGGTAAVCEQPLLQPAEDGGPALKAGERIGGGTLGQATLFEHLLVHRLQGQHIAILQVEPALHDCQVVEAIKAAQSVWLQLANTQLHPAPTAPGIGQQQPSLADLASIAEPVMKIDRLGSSPNRWKTSAPTEVC
jgi:hypothetical protein